MLNIGRVTRFLVYERTLRRPPLSIVTGQPVSPTPPLLSVPSVALQCNVCDWRSTKAIELWRVETKTLVMVCTFEGYRGHTTYEKNGDTSHLDEQ